MEDKESGQGIGTPNGANIAISWTGGREPRATHFGSAGAISCSGVAQATRFFMSFLAQHRTARAVPLLKHNTGRLAPYRY